MREQLLHLPRDSDKTLQAQIREMLVAAILDGNIPGGSPLPSGRKLAQQLNVARNTVVLAYQQLVDEGYLVARERSGYYVSEDILRGVVDAPPRERPRGEHTPDWEARFSASLTEHQHVRVPPDWQDYDYPFVRGQFDPIMFPVADWRDAVRQSLSLRSIREWAGDAVEDDDPMLIEQLRTRVLPRRGVLAQADEILVTLGSQQGMYLLTQLLMDRHSVVGIEDPGYPDARNVFLMRTPHLRALPVDRDGLLVDQRVDDCDYVYVTPSHQYPTTVTLSLARRRALLDKAARHDFVMIEDDYESETNYIGEPTPALKSLDDNQRVIYLGSMSKYLAPGLRIGYMVGPAELIREARILRRLMLRHPPANNQRTIALFVAQGHHDSLIRRIAHTFGDRWQVMRDALHHFMPGMSETPSFGGSAYWIEGPKTLDGARLYAEARRESILIDQGYLRFLSENPPMNYFSLSFSSIGIERIEPGIRKLSQLIERLSVR